jgi:hypothetical protein
MLTAILLCITMQLPPDFNFSSFNNKDPIKNDIKFTAQKLAKDPYFYGKDIFGKSWKSLDKAALDSKIKEINDSSVAYILLKYTMTDKNGLAWEHEDKAVLERYIQYRNSLP